MYINNSLGVILQLCSDTCKEDTVVWSDYTELECFGGLNIAALPFLLSPGQQSPNIDWN